MNSSDASIFPVVSFLFDHYIDYKTFLAQPTISSKLLPKDFIFLGQFALMTPVPIETTTFFEKTPPASRVPVIISFN